MSHLFIKVPMIYWWVRKLDGLLGCVEQWYSPLEWINIATTPLRNPTTQILLFQVIGWPFQNLTAQYEKCLISLAYLFVLLLYYQQNDWEKIKVFSEQIILIEFLGLIHTTKTRNVSHKQKKIVSFTSKWFVSPYKNSRGSNPGIV